MRAFLLGDRLRDTVHGGWTAGHYELYDLLVPAFEDLSLDFGMRNRGFTVHVTCFCNVYDLLVMLYC